MDCFQTIREAISPWTVLGHKDRWKNPLKSSHINFDVTLFCFLKSRLLLFLLHSGSIELATVRIPGVLQRFCISYLVVATTGALATRVCANEHKPQSRLVMTKSRNFKRLSLISWKSLVIHWLTFFSQTGWKYYLTDLVAAWPRWIVCSCCILLHTTITFLMPVPGCPTGTVLICSQKGVKPCLSWFFSRLPWACGLAPGQ